jgi:hypothetical protein
LPTPERVGAEPLAVCALSGLRATPSCPSLVEWFLPGTAPVIRDDWQSDGRTSLPAEYADWLAMQGDDAEGASVGNVRNDDARKVDMTVAGSAGTTRTRPFITSPRDGDAYEIPPGLDPRYSTLPLTASREGARWFVDDRPFTGARWPITTGRHVVRALWDGGASDSVRILVR